MAVKNLDIWRAAKQLLDQYEKAALKEALNRVKDARKVGDGETEVVWIRIARAITELQKTEPNGEPLN